MAMSNGQFPGCKVAWHGSVSMPPQELRILLLGKNSSEISSVGNLILGRDAFLIEAPPPSVQQCSERASGKLKAKNITLINTPHMFDSQPSVDELIRRVTECMSLCAPGPHVIVLVLQPDDFTETNRDRLYSIVCSLSKETLKHTLVLTTQTLQSGTRADPVKENVSQKIITECNNRHIEFRGRGSRVALLNMIEVMVEENGGSYLKWGTHEALAAREQKQREQTKQEKSEPTIWGKTNNMPMDNIKNKGKSPKEQKQHEHPTQIKSEPIMWGERTNLLKVQEKTPQRLNLVVCGSDDAVKSSISDLILGQKEPSPESSSVCVRREGEVCGHLVTLVEMTALYNTQLSEEEVMWKSSQCVSFCDPGVHAFLLTVPGGRLTDEDKVEIEKIQRIFSSTVNDYLILLFATENKETKTLINSCGQRYRIVEAKVGRNPKQVPELLEEIKRQTKHKHYSLHMYVMAQEERIRHELEEKHKEELNKMDKIIKELNGKGQSEGKTQKPGDLRIVLLGKTGVGKSATANTILEKKVYRELLCARSVTTECQKESSDDTYNVKRHVTVIDTPGLFDTSTSKEEISKEIIKCITMAAPGPHVFLLVISLGRFTEEEQDAVKMIQELFGEESRRYTMVLFTRGDELQRMKMSIEEFIKDSEHSLQNIIHQCGNRHHVFNNRNTEDRSQVTDLLEKIDSMVAANGGSFYTNEMFQRAEKALQKEQNRILKDKEEEIEKEKEELRKKHEAEMEKLKRTIQEEQQKQERERKRREEEFKKREEQVRREFAEREQFEQERYKKQREGEEKKMKEWMAEVTKEREENRKQWARQREEDQRGRDQEEKERRKKEEEWKQKQREEKEKLEEIKKEMIEKQRDHQYKLQQEYEQKIAEEENRLRELEEKIKHAEESKKKELVDLQLTQQREWRRKMQEEKKRREQEENKWREKMESLENEWKFQQNKKQQKYEHETTLEMERRALEQERKKQKEEEEKRRIENEAKEKIKRMQVRLQRDTESRQQEKQYQKQLEENLRTQRELFHKFEQERARVRRREEERHLAYIRVVQEQQKEKLRKNSEVEARHDAEKGLCAKVDRKFEEAKAEGQVSTGAESPRTIPGRTLDAAINWVWSFFA